MTGTLAAEVEDLARFMAGQATERETAPMLVLVDATRNAEGSDRVVAVLDGGDGAAQARAARMLVLFHCPRMAILAMEGWTVKRSVPHTDRDYQRVLRREITPSQLPPAKRGELLIVYGETAAGESLTRLFDLERLPDGTRRAFPLEMTEMTSRFHPLFMAEAGVRAMREQGHMDPSLSPDAALDAARAAVALFLLSGDGHGTTSAAYERDLRRALRSERIRTERGN